MKVSASVVAPVPWFPFKSRIWGKYGEFGAISEAEVRAQIPIYHPRFPVVPKVGMLLTPALMASATAGAVESAIHAMGEVGLIDAHYFYPDGVAASRIAQRLNLPFIVTARGSDINLIAQMERPRKMILKAARQASAIVAVSDALAREMERIGVSSTKIHVVRNGVNLKRFNPGDRQLARNATGIDGLTFLSVGELKEAKGHHLAIESLLYNKHAKLVVVGQGGYERHLRSIVEQYRLQNRVTFAGRLGEAELCTYYQAADALILASRREGMPNVILESLACGTPVIAADVGGIREIISDSCSGELLGDRSGKSIADAWAALVQRGVDRIRIRKIAEQYSWDDSIAKLHQLMLGCMAKRLE